MKKHPAELLSEYARTATSEEIRATMKEIAPEFEEVMAYYRACAEDPSLAADDAPSPLPPKSPQVSPGIDENGRITYSFPSSEGSSNGTEKEKR